jgi:hypothetical protein
MEFVKKYMKNLPDSSIGKRWIWSSISKNPGIKLKDIEENIQYPWNWNYVSYNPNLTIKFVEKNIQNDPFVAPTNLIDPTCLTRPHDIFFVELASKLGLFYKELQERRVKAYFLYSSLIKYDIHLLDNIEKIKYSSMINYPLKFSSEVVRDQAAIYLLDHGVDASKQIYRNIHQVHGYEALPGSTKNIEALINRLLFIPIHRDVTFTQVMNISQLMKDFFGTYD